MEAQNLLGAMDPMAQNQVEAKNQMEAQNLLGAMDPMAQNQEEAQNQMEAQNLLVAMDPMASQNPMGLGTPLQKLAIHWEHGTKWIE